MNGPEAVERLALAAPAVDIPQEGLHLGVLSDCLDALIDQEFIGLAQFTGRVHAVHVNCRAERQCEPLRLQGLIVSGCCDI